MKTTAFRHRRKVPIVALGLAVLSFNLIPLPVWAQQPNNAVPYRGRNGERFTYNCPGPVGFGSLWGTGTYTDDSDVCTAAVHDGRINQATGGTVVIEILPGQSSYQGTLQNGVQSANYGSWGSSFRFVSTPAGGTQQAANRPPYAPTLVGPQSTWERPVAIGPTAATIELSWRLNGDPDNDPVASWLDLFRWNAQAQRWEPVYSNPINATSYTLQSPGLAYDTYYAWQVFAIDPNRRTGQWYTPSGWSYFKTSPAPGGGDDWIIEITP